MLRLITSFFAAITSALCISISYAKSTTPKLQPLIVKAGDLTIQKDKSGWSAIKILVVDSWPDASAAAHCLTYETTFSKPTFESLKEAKVQIWHALINVSGFKDWELIGNQAPSKGEFSGFIEYLKLTDFPRYVSFTGQDSSEIVRQANEHYQKAYALGRSGQAH